MNHYTRALAELKAQPCHKLSEVGDQWQTPPALYWGINALFGPFLIDLFTDGENSKCPRFYTAENNALLQDWAKDLAGGKAFANPPYSRSSYDDDKNAITGMRNIMAKVMTEREKGARIVLLLKSATSEVWWPEQADHVAFVRGRISFDLPAWFVPASNKDKASSAGFAVAICVFDKEWRGQPMQYIGRESLLAQGNAIIDMIEQRASELAQQYVGSTIEQRPDDAEPGEQIAGFSDAGELVGTHIDEGAKVCTSEVNESDTQQSLTAATEEQAEQIATKCVEQSGADIDGGTNTENPGQRFADEEVPPALPSKFTIDSMCDYIRAGKLPFDGVPMALTLKLYEMFGEHEEYTLRQIRTAIIAIEEPGMVAKSEPEPEQAHNWPVEVYTALGNALTKKPMKLTKPQRETVCSAINQKILNGGTKDEATSVAIELLQGYQSCAA